MHCGTNSLDKISNLAVKLGLGMHSDAGASVVSGYERSNNTEKLVGIVFWV